MKILKVAVGIFISLSLFLGSCKANTPPNSKDLENLQTEQTALPNNEIVPKSTKMKSFTPLQIGKKVTELSPYVMSSYGFQKLIGAEHFQISLYAAHYEDMVFEDDVAIVAVMFVLRGDLHEMPLAFYVLGDLNPDFSNTLNFCTFDGDVENKLTIYASSSCDSVEAPSTGVITIEFNLGSNDVVINGGEKHQLN